MKSAESVKYRRSRQRNRILEILDRGDFHPTANEIYDLLREDFSSLSLGNVYRNLNILVEQKKIQRIDAGSTFDRFETVKNPHHHFICQRCGRVTDLELPMDESLNTRVAEETGCVVHGHRTEFIGTCSNCR